MGFSGRTADVMRIVIIAMAVLQIAFLAAVGYMVREVRELRAVAGQVQAEAQSRDDALAGMIMHYTHPETMGNRTIQWILREGEFRE